MRYAYKAKRGPKEVVESVVEAVNEDAAVAKISLQGLVPIIVREESEYSPGRSGARRFGLPAFRFKRRVSKEDIYFFTKQLKALLRSQVPILNSLYILEEQAEKRSFKDLLGKIIQSVRDGANFSDSLERFPEHFPPIYLSIVKAGEASGKLDHSLEQISKYLDRDRELSQKVKSSLAYPMIMIAVGAATVIFLMTFIVPKLSVLFEDFSDKIPLATKILLSGSFFMSKYRILLAALFLLLGLTVYKTRQTAGQRRLIDGIKKRTPLIKDIIYNQSVCRLARGLSILLVSGVSILDSVRIATPLVGDRTAEEGLRNVYKQIVAGTALEESFQVNCPFLPKIFIKMIAIGVASGRLDEILGELADNYAEEIEAETKMVTTLVEPIAILVVGGILGFIAIAVLLPIFGISFSIK